MSETGNYILLLHLPTDEILTIGKLGTFDFPAGWYAYAGSAFGPGGLVGRLKHHLQPVDRPHWHIDYLRQVTQLKEIWLSPDAETRERDWADLMLAIPGATTLVEGFGAADSDRETIFSISTCAPLWKILPWACGLAFLEPKCCVPISKTRRDDEAKRR